MNNKEGIDKLIQEVMEELIQERGIPVELPQSRHDAASLKKKKADYANALGVPLDSRGRLKLAKGSNSYQAQAKILKALSSAGDTISKDMSAADIRAAASQRGPGLDMVLSLLQYTTDQDLKNDIRNILKDLAKSKDKDFEAPGGDQGSVADKLQNIDIEKDIPKSVWGGD